ncbi:MAG: hypothetical protein OXG72_11380 [Acidobacteria bacterium]|nr:hypothetical protein [Acidobacteriota bacterium]
MPTALDADHSNPPQPGRTWTEVGHTLGVLETHWRPYTRAADTGRPAGKGWRRLILLLRRPR